MSKEMPMINVAMIKEISVGGNLISLEKVLSLEITQKINEHAKIQLVMRIDDNERDLYLKLAKSDTLIKIIQWKVEDGKKEKAEAILFSGVVTNMEIAYGEGRSFIVRVEGASHSYEMDIELRKRSFPGENMTYDELFKEIESGHPEAVVDHLVGDKIKLKSFLVQYNETDWSFLKRCASHFRTGLCPDIRSEKPKFSLGIHDGRDRGRIEDYDSVFRVNKDSIELDSRNLKDQSVRKEYITIEIRPKIGFLFNIGDYFAINLTEKKENEGNLFIREAVIWLEDSELKTKYLLDDGNKAIHEMYFNKQISGVSLEGTVVGREQDKVKVQLEMDKKWVKPVKEKTYFFPHATTYTAGENTGWYCMPEMGDTVNLYFPTNIEAEAIVMNSTRKINRANGGEGNGDGSPAGDSGGKTKDNNGEEKKLKIDNPDVKYFRTKFGKELMFSEDEIQITGKDKEILIKLNEKDGIIIYSKENLNIFAEKDMYIHSKEGSVEIAANAGIDLVCKESSIKMNGETLIKGKSIKMNK